MNILFSSVGKRVELVNSFRRTAQELGLQIELYGVDLNPEFCPSRFVLDNVFKVPRVTDEGFADTVLKICISNGIKAIIPTIDTELLIYADNIEKFKSNGISVVLSEGNFIRTCRDKRLTNQFFEQLGIEIPKPYKKTELVFPVFAKPYDGSLSKDLYILKGTADLTEEILSNPKLMFMEYVDPSEYTEYTVDAYFNLQGQLKCLVPRERLVVRAGEVNQGVTDKGEVYRALKDRLSAIDEKLGLRGCITFQFFFNKQSHRIIGIEVNPRFGGGYPLTFEAKGNYSEYVIKEYLLFQTHTEFIDDWEDKYLMLRYDAAFFTKQE